jgi:hypothetical protein
MDEKELREILKKLEDAGWQPQLCDTPIPYFDNPVKCGLPNGVGDVVEKRKMIPRKFLSMQPEFVVTVQGDSMKDANILDGDAVKVQTNAHVHDGDVVLAMIDEEFTVKSYCEDEDGHPWLVPQNDEYEAFPLMESEDTWILGVVKEVIKAAPRIAARTCMKFIKKAKMKEPPALTRQQVEEMIVDVAPMVKNGRQWYAVFRALVDKKYFGKCDFEAFCDLVASVVPQHEHLPDAGQMQRLAVQSFAKSIVLWDEKDAPVTGKPFKDYRRIADKVLELLTT